MDIGYAIEHIENETQRRQTEKFQLLSTPILGLLNEPLLLLEASNAILWLIKKETGLDAAGIRLKDGDDFPYFSEEGFDKEFLLAEKRGPPSDHVTQAGSIWTNDSLALLDSLNGHDPRLRPRNRCIHEGFLSVALIPIRADQQVIGLQEHWMRARQLSENMIRYDT
jgi:hypothetical protein